MKIEIEKKYDLTEHDYDIIKAKCNFVEEKEVKDYYLDDQNYTLLSNAYRLRMRNGRYELKIKANTHYDDASRSVEIDNEEEIETALGKFNLSTDDVSGVLEVITQREEYILEFDGYQFTIDIDRYKYGAGYEIELTLEDDKHIDASELINDFRTHLGLNASQLTQEGKVATCAMHENMQAYNAILKAEQNIDF